MAYDKYTWKNGEVITQEKLNHIEDGIASIDAGSGGGSFDLSDRMAKGTGDNAVIEGLVIPMVDEGETFVNTASGGYAHAEGFCTIASGYGSHAEGDATTASSDDSHAEGYNTTASGGYSHAEGAGTTASGNVSHAEGDGTTASGQVSHAEGAETIASGDWSHAEGAGTKASGYWSHASGWSTIANHRAQHVFGAYNIEDPSSADNYEQGTYIEIVGNGNGDDPQNVTRSNARTLDWSGNEWIAGNFFMDGSIITMAGTSRKKYQMVIDDTTDPSTPTLKITALVQN